MGLIWHPRPSPAQRLPALAAATGDCPSFSDARFVTWQGAVLTGADRRRYCFSDAVPGGFYWFLWQLAGTIFPTTGGFPIDFFLCRPGFFSVDPLFFPMVSNFSQLWGNAIKIGQGRVGGTQTAKFTEQGMGTQFEEVQPLNQNRVIVPTGWRLLALETDGIGMAASSQAFLKAVYLELPLGVQPPSL